MDLCRVTIETNAYYDRLDSADDVEEVAAQIIASECWGEIAEQLSKSQLGANLVAAVMRSDWPDARSIIDVAVWDIASDSDRR